MGNLITKIAKPNLFIIIEPTRRIRRECSGGSQWTIWRIKIVQDIRTGISARLRKVTAKDLNTLKKLRIRQKCDFITNLWI